MFVEYKHMIRKPNGTITGYPDNMFEERKQEDPTFPESRGEYLGKISENEIIGQVGSGMTGTALVFIRRNLHKTKSPHDLSLNVIPKFEKLRTMGGWHGSDVNTNLVVGFNKKQLMEILNSMQDSDVLNIAHVPTGYKG